MSDSATETTETTEPAAAPAKEEAQLKTPVIDTDAIAAQAARAALGAIDVSKIREEAAKDIKKELARTLSGEPEKKEPHQLHQKMAADPEGFYNALVDLAKTEVKQELAAETAQKAKNAQVYNEVKKEFPGIESVPNEVYADYAAALKSAGGKSPEAVLRESLKATAKRLKLKKASEEDMDVDSVLPNSRVSMGVPAHTVNNEKSAMDYFKAGKARFAGARTPK